MSVRYSGSPLPRSTRRVAAIAGAMLFTASCANVPYKGPKTATGLPPHLNTDAGQVLRYCQTIRETGNLVAAAGLCERAYQLDPNNPEPLLQLAGILTQMGELNQAVAVYRTVLTRAPDHVEAHYGLGRTYVALEQYDLALGEFRTALRGKPDDARLYNAVGVADGLLGAHASAQEIFRAGLDKAPTNVTLRNNLGLSLVLSGNYAEGLQILEAAAADPNADKISHENLLLAQGLYAQARTDAMLAAATGLASAELENTGDNDAAYRLPDDAAPDEIDEIAAPDASAISTPPMVADRPHRIARAIAEAQTPASSASMHTDPTVAHKPTALTGAFGAMPEEAFTAPAPRAIPMPAPETVQTARAGATDYPESPRAGALENADPDLGPKDHVVQFASYSSHAQARLGWDIISAAAPDLLAGRTPNIQRADLGAERGVFFRLRSRPEPEVSARRLCDALSERSMDCLVMRITLEDAADAAPPRDTPESMKTTVEMPIQPAAGAVPEAKLEAGPEADPDLPPLP